ncbi:MAG TPA: glycosyltransferase family 2 protein [bacterium]|nr:glycosyltransferase family 2 protein [bacterium]HPN80957.1 glycosyltransferase family 2 protein [bacterium]HPW39381.1 glycosyltransferase family 2 protein [bacterium]
MARGNKILAVITTYNRVAFIKRLLMSLSLISGPKFDVLIIDDCSDDDYQSLVADRQYGFSLDYIRNHQQSGPIFSLNLSIDYAINKDYDYLWWLNDDSVVAEGTLEQLLSVLTESEMVAVAGSAVYDVDYPSHLISAGYFFDFDKLMPRINFSSQSVDYVSTCSDLVKVAVFKKTGLRFDSAYFIRSYDVDFYFRLKKYGYQIIAVKTAPVYHPNFINDSADKQYYNLRNNCYFCLKFNQFKSKQQTAVFHWLAKARKLYHQEYSLEAATFYWSVVDFFRSRLGQIDFYGQAGFELVDGLDDQRVIFPYFGQTAELAMIGRWLKQRASGCSLTVIFPAGQPVVKLSAKQNNIILPAGFFYRLIAYLTLIGRFDYIIIPGGIRNLIHPFLADRKIKLEKNNGRFYVAGISWLDYYWFDLKIYWLILAIRIKRYFFQTWRRQLLKQSNH